MNRIYLDNAATTQPAPEVIDAMLTCLRKTYGNPSSLHSVGLEARGMIESARRKMAAFINASPDEVIFTGSGTGRIFSYRCRPDLRPSPN